MEHQQSGSCYHHGLFKFCQGQELQHNEVFRPKSRKRFPGRSRNGPRSSYQVQQNVDVRRTFADSQNANAVMDDVRQVPYRGSGTRTGQAIQYALENIFQPANGMRPDAPQILVTITDGKSQDDVLAPSEAIRASGISTYAVGIGTTIDRSEVVKISGAEERAFTTASFAALETTVLENIRVSLCQNKDECLVDNGGCSH